MIGRRGALVFLTVLAASPVIAMTDQSPAPALALDIREGKGTIEVTLTGTASERRDVAYTLEVTGSSTSRHRANTTLAAGEPAVLSTITIGSRADWCVRLQAHEADGETYEIVRGPCAGTPA